MPQHIKSAILALAAVLLIAAAASAAGTPKIVAAEPIKDAGTVAKGDKIVHDFAIRNEGDAVLEITNVQPACGCTVAEFDIEAVDPQACVTNARRFDTSVFAKSFPREVERAVREDEHRGPDYRRGPRPRFAWSPGRR